MDISKFLDALDSSIQSKAEAELDNWFCKYVQPIKRIIISTKPPTVKGNTFSWTDVEGKYTCSFPVPKQHFHFFKGVKELTVYGLPNLLKDGKYWAIKADNITLGSDIVPYKFGGLWREAQGISNKTIIPEANVVESKNKLTEILNARKQLEITNKNNIHPEVLLEEENFTEISGLSFEEKSENILRFCSNIDSEIFDVFKNIENCEINKDPYGKFNLSMEVKRDTEFDQESKKVVALRNKTGRIRVDCTDGELLVAFYYNKVFEYLGLDKRFSIDTNSYKNMGDDGDIRAGTMRIDIKTRNKTNKKLNNLLIDDTCISNGYNEFGLVHRVGDPDCKGNDRRLFFIGTIETSEILQKYPEGPTIINHKPKYEVKPEELHCITHCLIRTLAELLERKDI